LLAEAAGAAASGHGTKLTAQKAASGADTVPQTKA
jgi:hypothetical protein